MYRGNLMHKLDHILWATPDLAEGTEQIAELLGVQPEVGGKHPGFGTRNSLLSLGDEVYLEIIAPDPEQDLKGNRGEQLAALDRPHLLTFAVRTFDMKRVEELVSHAGLETQGAIAMSRRHPEGRLLTWQVLRLDNHSWGDVMPFFIDWGDTNHPAQTTPEGCALLEFNISHPEPEALADVYKALAIEAPVLHSNVARLEAFLETPKGQVTLQ